MGRVRRLRLPVLPLVLGVTDGMLNALTLAASSILDGGAGISLLLALRVGTAALVTAGFTMFVADYAERRVALARAERQLNMTRPGQLANSRLGRQAVRESLTAMTVAGLSSLAGAAAPLLVGALLTVPPWIVLAATVLSLAALGWVIGGMVQGRRLLWAVSMFVGGVAVTVVGLELHIA